YVRKKVQELIAELSVKRNLILSVKPSPNRDISNSFNHWTDHDRNLGRIMLSISINGDYNFCSGLEGGLKQAPQRRALAQITMMADYCSAKRLGNLSGHVIRTIIANDNLVHVLFCSENYRGNR